MKTIIGTWKMSYDAIKENELVENISDACVASVCAVEDNENFTSVGYGGLPNIDGILEMDSSYMSGKKLDYGCVMGVKDFKNPILISRSLHKHNHNKVLCGEGANKYALENGFVQRKMLTAKSYQIYLNDEEKDKELTSYVGHDTVCILGKSEDDTVACVSTSGLYLKKAGRVGDSPIIGAGLYADDELGAAAATGVGENVIRGCLSYRVVSLMKDNTARDALDIAIKEYLSMCERRGIKADNISMVAIDKNYNAAAITNIDYFPYTVSKDGITKLYVITKEGIIIEPDTEFLKLHKMD